MHHVWYHSRVRFLAPLILIGALLASQVVWAQESSHPFRDIRDASTLEAAMTLLHRNAVDANPSFSPERRVNRAEFIKMVMRASRPNFTPDAMPSCFSDVPANAWFARWICYLHAQGGVGGYAIAGRDPVFRPANTVNYAEALKILEFVYDLGSCPQPGDVIWYASCVNLARINHLDIGIAPATLLTRAEAVRLIAKFVAFDEGTSSSSNSRSSSSSSRLSSSSSRSSSSASRTSSSSSSASLDPLSDMTIHSQILLLGETGPVIGAVSLFLNDEALDTTKITVNLTADVNTTVESILLYDENRHYLGRATLTGNSNVTSSYSLSLSPGSLQIPYRTPFKIYARPVLFSKSLGGHSDQTVRISNFAIEGNGVWTSRKYTQNSTETFQSFLTARSVITKVTNAAEANAGLVTGSKLRLGAFRFEGRKTDALAKIDITQLIFQIEQTGGVSLADVKLGADGTNERLNCTVSSSLVTCPLIPDTYGSLSDGPRTITLYGDVSVSDMSHASLRLTLNEAGSISTTGSVTWSDGTNSFTWVPVDSPVASGTRYSY